MYAVILAAGVGTRMGKNTPKSLIEIGDELTLIGNQIRILSRLVGAHRIVLVLGYRAMDFIATYPNLMYVYNERYASTNTAKSLLCALRKLDGNVLWTNGDVYCEEQTFRRVINTHTECSRALVNHEKTTEEEIKYSLYGDGSIAQLSKQVESPLGESLGIQIVHQKDMEQLNQALEMVGDHDYFEKALEIGTLSRKIRLMPVDVVDGYCREVDYPEDLDAVRAYVAKKR